MGILTSEAGVLTALREGPASGVELMARVRTIAAGAGMLGAGALYPLLRRLEAAGLVRAWMEQGRERVGRPRRFHELTVRGVEALERQRQLLRLLADSSSPPAPSPALTRRMRSNIRRAFRVSAFARRLRVEVAS
jgi:DNA-binding PadR family transcriptional regulator